MKKIFDSQKIASKIKFTEDVSNKKKDVDFYHNRGKDSSLNLNEIENLDKIEFSEESEEEEEKQKIQDKNHLHQEKKKTLKVINRIRMKNLIKKKKKE